MCVILHDVSVIPHDVCVILHDVCVILHCVCVVQVGSYLVTYSARDVAGNTATASRTVNVVNACIGSERFCPSTCR